MTQETNRRSSLSRLIRRLVVAFNPAITHGGFGTSFPGFGAGT